MKRLLFPVTLLATLGCMGGLGDAEAPRGDTAAPAAVDPPLPVDDGVVEGAPTDTAAAPAEPGAEEGDGSEDPARRPRRRRRKPGAAPRPAPHTSPKPAPAPAPVEEVAPAPKPKPKPKGPPTPSPGGIDKVADTTWQVTQANVDRWKDDPYILSSVHQEDVGWSLVYARKREAWHLGMRNKDVILEVNGKKLNSKAQLVAAYLALKNKKEFDVLFERNGKKRTHHYVVK